MEETLETIEIEMTIEEFATLQWFKNYMTMKLRSITNQEVLDEMIPVEGTPFKKLPEDAEFIYDLEPEYTFGECIKDIIDSVMDEQQTGQVNFIT